MKRDDAGMLSIGALSVATGVPIETIRSWERRYGFPVAERKPSGHRVYPLSVVPRLRLVSKALASGHRAAEVVAASESALESLLAALPLPASERVARQAPDTRPLDDRGIMAAIRRFHADELQRAFQADWTTLGPLGFVQHRAGPLLREVGDAWEAGTIDVRHEHFASACLGDFLRSARMPLGDRATGPVVALATLPDELHGMGLQMSAVVFALAGWRVLMLGTNTPVDQIAAVGREASISAVAISCALPRRKRTSEALRMLRRRLPRAVPILVGGAGAPS
ncbi:MAG TPA: cobalamin B12-binding domain-containing protein, partial [Gemmatimonadaceae bacterium]